MLGCMLRYSQGVKSLAMRIEVYPDDFAYRKWGILQLLIPLTALNTVSARKRPGLFLPLFLFSPRTTAVPGDNS